MAEIERKLIGKSPREKSDIKSSEILKYDFLGKKLIDKFEIEILSIDKIEGGIEIFARAWKDGNHLGFGKDGTVDIERFRIFNPPVLIDDPNGDIIRKTADSIKGAVVQRRLKEDPVEAIRQSLSHTIGLIGKDGNNVVKGKVGNTTDTFYPDAGKPGTNSVDGEIQYRGAAAYSTAHDATDGTHTDFDGANRLVVMNAKSGGLYYIARTLINFNTSTIGTDNIDSATLSIKHDTLVNNSNSDSVSIVQNTISSNVNYTVADFDLFGTTKYAADKTWASLTTDVYADFSLTDTTIINKTGVSHFGVRSTQDVANTAPGADGGWLGFYSADNTGTTSDPKLVVVHSVASVVKDIISSGFIPFPR